MAHNQHQPSAGRSSSNAADSPDYRGAYFNGGGGGTPASFGQFPTNHQYAQLHQQQLHHQQQPYYFPTPGGGGGGGGGGQGGGHPAAALLNLKRPQLATGLDDDGSGGPSRAPGSSSKKQKRGTPSSEEDDEDEDDEDDESDDGGAGGGGGGGGGGTATGKPSGKAGQKGKAKAGAVKNEPGVDGKGKVKATRGSRACTVCRKLKMRCFSEDGPPCKRCKAGGHECIFEESNRGKKSSKKHEAMALSLRKMEKTLDTVLRSIHNPTMASLTSGMVTRSPSPSTEGMSPGSLATYHQQRAANGSNTLPPIHLLGYRGPNDHPGVQTAQGSASRASQHVFDTLVANANAAAAAAANSHSANTNLNNNVSTPSASSGSGSVHGSLAHPRPQYPPNTGNNGGAIVGPGRYPIGSSSQSSGASDHPHLPLALRRGSPRLHSLPDNSLNPLGLLAEASLHNHKRAEAKQEWNSGGPLSAALGGGGGAGGGTPGGEVGGSSSRATIGPTPMLGAGSGSSRPGAMGKKSETSDLRSRPPSVEPREDDNEASASARMGTPAGGGDGGGGGGGGRGGGANGAEVGDTVAMAAKALAGHAAGVAASRGGSAGPPAVSEQLGVAGTGYFRPGPMTMLPLRRIIIERSVRPEILDFITSEEVDDLFEIYFNYISPQLPVLDRSFHTPGVVASRSPFLLTAICSVASKFYSKRPELNAKLNTYARKLAFETPNMGYKSVEIVQAYLILTSYGLPVERFEQDRTWLLLGMGIRVATDLNLQRKSAISGKDTEESRARDREIVNRERTWLMCYVLDRSLSAQMGKPYTIREDYIIRNSSVWANSHLRFSIPTDRGLVAYTGLQQILSRSLDFIYSGTSTASGLQSEIDYPIVLRSVEAQLNTWDDDWQRNVHEALYNVDEATVLTLTYSRSIGKLYHNYSKLMINSFGLQSALERSPIDLGHFYSKVSVAAMNCVIVARDELLPSGRLPYSPDSTFVMISYAVLSLLKLLRPELALFLESPSTIIDLSKDAVRLLEEAAVSPTHTPALYATLLRSLLTSSTDSRPPSMPSTPYPGGTSFSCGPSRPASRGPLTSGANGAGGFPNTSGGPGGNGGGGGLHNHHGLSVSTEGHQNLDPSLAPAEMHETLSGGAPGADWGTFSTFPDGGSLGYGGEFGMMNAEHQNGMHGGGPGGYGGGGGDGAWSVPGSSFGDGLNLESIWPANQGLFDSMLMPGHSSGMAWHGGVVTFGNGGSGYITPRVASPGPLNTAPNSAPPSAPASSAGGREGRSRSGGGGRGGEGRENGDEGGGGDDD